MMKNIDDLTARLDDVLRNWTNVTEDEQSVIREAAAALRYATDAGSAPCLRVEPRASAAAAADQATAKGSAMTITDDLIARLIQAHEAAGFGSIHSSLLYEAAAALREQRDEIAQADEAAAGAIRHMRQAQEWAKKAEAERDADAIGHDARMQVLKDTVAGLQKDVSDLIAERDALKSKVAVAEQAEALYCAQSRRLEECRTERDAAMKALMALWNLWNDPKWVRYKADYERGHLSYANMLDEAERPILPAIDAAMKAKP